MAERKAMIEKGHAELSTSAQCRLLGITRSTLYYKPCGEDAENLQIMRLLDEQYLTTPFYGVRKLQAWLGYKGMVCACSRDCSVTSTCITTSARINR